MTDPFDREFSRQLKLTDQPVSIDSDEITRQLTKRRANHLKLRHQAVALVAVAGLACLLVAGAWWNSGKTNPIASNPSVEQGPKPANENNENNETDHFGDFFANEILLADVEAKRRELELQVRSLRQAKAQQEWVLAREVVSRTSIGTPSNFPYEL